VTITASMRRGSLGGGQQCDSFIQDEFVLTSNSMKNSGHMDFEIRKRLFFGTWMLCSIRNSMDRPDVVNSQLPQAAHQLKQEAGGPIQDTR